MAKLVKPSSRQGIRRNRHRNSVNRAQARDREALRRRPRSLLQRQVVAAAGQGPDAQGPRRRHRLRPRRPRGPLHQVHRLERAHPRRRLRGGQHREGAHQQVPAQEHLAGRHPLGRVHPERARDDPHRLEGHHGPGQGREAQGDRVLGPGVCWLGEGLGCADRARKPWDMGQGCDQSPPGGKQQALKGPISGRCQFDTIAHKGVTGFYPSGGVVGYPVLDINGVVYSFHLLG